MKIIVAGAIFSVLIGALGLVTTYGIDGREPLLQPAVAAASAAAAAPLRCVAFGPYVAGYDPNTGPHPPASVIGKLLDRLVAQTDFRCIMTYGVLNGLGRTFPAAKRRGIKVIAIIWLDLDRTVNARSIRRGIRAAKAYPNTIIRLSCGSEVRTRHGTALDDEVTACISALRRAGVSQPITTIDTWWEWCNRSYPCKRMPLAARVDWIGINVFPW
jgi:exo-beta-1,3-glucanase (GH17 family)